MGPSEGGKRPCYPPPCNADWTLCGNPTVIWTKDITHTGKKPDCTKIAVNPNGKNINLECGAVNISELSKKVLNEKADIGFAFDGDGDRIIAVDELGNEIDGDNLIALFATKFLKLIELNKKTIVATVMSNLGFEKYLKEKLKLKLIRKDVGDINVISEMMKNNYILGGEQSGHIILGQYMNTGDGILAALKITEILSGENVKASKLFKLYKKFPQIKHNLKIKNVYTKKNQAIINKKVLSFKKKYSNLRFLVRKSGTEPLLRILVEGEKNNIVKNASKQLIKDIRKLLNA